MQNLKAYYLIPADNRDLNYDKYFSKGIKSKNYFRITVLIIQKY